MAGFRESLPASLQAILQNGLLDHVFEDALVASFLYDTLADVRPWPGGLGSTSIMTRGGLLTPNTVPITGNDAAVSGYGFEQYQLQMNQYGGSIDTNMATSAMALASKFLQDNDQAGHHGRAVPRLGGSGQPVWRLLRWERLCDWSPVRHVPAYQ